MREVSDKQSEIYEFLKTFTEGGYPLLSVKVFKNFH